MGWARDCSCVRGVISPQRQNCWVQHLVNSQVFVHLCLHWQWIRQYIGGSTRFGHNGTRHSWGYSKINSAVYKAPCIHLHGIWCKTECSKRIDRSMHSNGSVSHVFICSNNISYHTAIYPIGCSYCWCYFLYYFSLLLLPYYILYLPLHYKVLIHVKWKTRESIKGGSKIRKGGRGYEGCVTGPCSSCGEAGGVSFASKFAIYIGHMYQSTWRGQGAEAPSSTILDLSLACLTWHYYIKCWLHRYTCIWPVWIGKRKLSLFTQPTGHSLEKWQGRHGWNVLLQQASSSSALATSLVLSSPLLTHYTLQILATPCLNMDSNLASTLPLTPHCCSWLETMSSGWILRWKMSVISRSSHPCPQRIVQYGLCAKNQLVLHLETFGNAWLDVWLVWQGCTWIRSVH